MKRLNKDRSLADPVIDMFRDAGFEVYSQGITHKYHMTSEFIDFSLSEVAVRIRGINTYYGKAQHVMTPEQVRMVALYYSLILKLNLEEY